MLSISIDRRKVKQSRQIPPDWAIAMGSLRLNLSGSRDLWGLSADYCRKNDPTRLRVIDMRRTRQVLTRREAQWPRVGKTGPLIGSADLGPRTLDLGFRPLDFEPCPDFWAVLLIFCGISSLLTRLMRTKTPPLCKSIEAVQRTGEIPQPDSRPTFSLDRPGLPGYPEDSNRAPFDNLHAAGPARLL